MAKAKTAPLKWKRNGEGRYGPETYDGRFQINGHWNTKPGYYELIDTQTHRRERGTRLKDLKSRAQQIVNNE